MKSRQFARATLLPIMLTVGCAVGHGTATQSPIPSEQWSGQLNARGGQYHEGSYLLSLSVCPHGLEGEYQREQDRCLTSGRFQGTRQGDELRGAVTQGEQRLEIRATLAGESFFGTYTFTDGPCQGDWGSTVAQRVLTTD